MKSLHILIALLLTAGVGGALAFEQTHRATAPSSLIAYVPQNAMLSIESPDFAGLLNRWSASPESRAWLKSSNYAAFQNSRLFGRLGDAQSSYATAAGLTPDGAFLNQMAGKLSVFAWYDIGKLEFLYITRMPAAQAGQTPLLQAKGGFERRHAGDSDFYIRPGTEAYRTVAFAQCASPAGDLLILATREDLMANALKLIAGDKSTPALATEPWFKDVNAGMAQAKAEEKAEEKAPEKSEPALHMAVNLDRVAYDPHFQTYWVQQNISWTRQYRASIADLYLEPGQFREERVLLPKLPLDAASEADVTPLAALAPPETGLVRAWSTANPDEAVEAIREKLLGIGEAPAADPRYAPDPSLEAPQTGSASDLETRIDALPPATPASTSQPLADMLRANGFDALMTLSSAQNPDDPAKLWVPIHSAVVLHASSEWNVPTFTGVLQRMLQGGFTAGNLGIQFHQATVAGHAIYGLDGPKPLYFAVLETPAQSHSILLADSQPLLLELLENTAATPTATAPANLIASFNRTTQRAPYSRLVSLVDGTNGVHPASGAAPFFSGNIESLSESFAALQSERLTQRLAGPNLRQTVTYRWNP